MKVLVAIDHRPSSQAICDAILKMRWHPRTEIHLLTVLSTDPETAMKTQSTPDDIENLAVEIHNILSHCDVKFMMRRGEPANTLLDYAEHVQAELIVLGSNCKNTVERLLIGSVSQDVLNRAHCPVIVAKTPCSYAQEPTPGFRNVLLPIDNSVFSDAAIRWLSNFAWAPTTNFFITAVAAPNSNLDEIEESLNNRALMLSQLTGSSNVGTELTYGEPHSAIINLAKEYYSDLIVMGSHGRVGIQKLILGSVSQAVSHDAPCAVAIVRGVVANDRSWHKTGAFTTIRPAITYNTPSNYSSSGSGGLSNDVHVLPSGM